MARAVAKSKRSEGTRWVHFGLDPDLHRRLRIVVTAEDTSVLGWKTQVVKKAATERWRKAAKGGE